MTDAAPAPAQGRGYWSIVWREFRKSRRSRAGLAAIGLFFAVAIYAPFLAERLPLVWMQDGALSSPLLQEFFAPSAATEKILERGYNACALYLPFAALACLLTRAPRRRRWRTGLLLAFAALAVLPFLLAKARNNPADYRALAASNAGRGLFPPVAYGPFETGYGVRRPPSWWRTEAGAAEARGARGTHLLGTDGSGRDVLARLIHGARVSLAVGIFATAIAAAIGIFVGGLAGYFGGWADLAISRLIEIVICFPVFFLILTIIAVMDERSILNIMLVIGCTSWTGIARLVRGSVLRERALDYVTAAQALGAGHLRILFRHILPNAIAPVLVSVTFGIASSILAEAGLSFLGFGVDTPTTSWGELLNQAREAPNVYWWLTLFPGLPIFLTVTVYNLAGEGLRDAMDPRLRKGHD